MRFTHTRWAFLAFCLLVGLIAFGVSYTIMGQGPGEGDTGVPAPGGGDEEIAPVPGGRGPVGTINELDQAIYSDDVDALRSLLEGGSNPNALTDDYNNTPLYTVIETQEETTNTLAMLDLMIEHGAAVNHSNSYGATPLSFVVAFGGEESEGLARKLVEAGANPHASRSYMGAAFPTPYEEALEEGNFAAAAGMRTVPGHTEPANLEELKMEGRHALLIRQMVDSTDPAEQRRLAETVIREAYEGDGLTEEQLQEFIRQLLDFESPHADPGAAEEDCEDCPTP